MQGKRLTFGLGFRLERSGRMRDSRDAGRLGVPCPFFWSRSTGVGLDQNPTIDGAGLQGEKKPFSPAVRAR